jgi:hypothetical protein
VTKRMACPRCRANGRDRAGDNLIVYEDGVHCFACGYHKGASTKKLPKENGFKYPNDFVHPARGWPEKKINPLTTLRYDVRAKLQRNEQGGVCISNGTPVTQGIYCLPYVEADKLVGYQIRSGRTFRGKGRVALIGGHLAKRNTECVIHEGWSDTLKGYEIDPKRDHYGLPSATAASVVQPYLPKLRTYQRIYIMLDPDEAGHNGVEALTQLLPKHKTLVATLPRADLCDSTRAEYKTAIENAESPIQILWFPELDLEPPKGFSTLYPKLDSMLGGSLYPEDCVALMGHTGIGKSTLARDIAYNFMSQGHKVLWIPTEMSCKQMLQAFLSRHIKKPVVYNHTLREWSVSIETMREARAWLAERLLFYRGPTTWADIKEYIALSQFQFGTQIVVLDVLDGVYEFSCGDWSKARMTINDMVQFTQEDLLDSRPPLATLVVAHTAHRQGSTAGKLTEADIRGSSTISQPLTGIIGIIGERLSSTRYLQVVKISRTHGIGNIHSSEMVYRTYYTER